MPPRKKALLMPGAEQDSGLSFALGSGPAFPWIRPGSELPSDMASRKPYTEIACSPKNPCINPTGG